MDWSFGAYPTKNNKGMVRLSYAREHNSVNMSNCETNFSNIDKIQL